jgi:D-xylose transport system substrate-binding protein
VPSNSAPGTSARVAVAATDGDDCGTRWSAVQEDRPMLRLRFGVVLIALSLVTGSCGGGGSDAARRRGPEKIKIGLLLDSLVEERWQRDRDLFLERVKELNADAIVKAANRDPALQEQQAKELLDQGVKALVVVAADAEKAAAIVDAAHAKKVPVISYDRLIQGADVDLYVSFDNLKVGRMQAEYLLNQAPKGNYLLIGGSPDDNNAKLLRQGQMEMLKPAVSAGSVKIVGDGWAQNWSEESAKTLTEEGLKKAHNGLAAIVASNDRTAAGAIQALTEHKLAGKVFVSGQDAELGAMKRIVAGTQSMTVYKPLRPLARMAAGAAVNMAKGQTEDGVVSINNGVKDVPARLLEPISVDKETMDRTVIADGYHKKNEVYGQ